MSDKTDLQTGSINGASNIVQFQNKNVEFEGGANSSQFKYSREKFKINFISAIALTAMVCAFTWMILGIYGSFRSTLYTTIVGSIFFAFMSIKMLRQYIQDKVILAINPNGLFDARWSDEIISWEKIKDISLHQREDHFVLSIWLWPNKNTPIPINQNPSETFQIDLEPLDGDPAVIVGLINAYKPVNMVD